MSGLWEQGKLYIPGDIVTPRTQPAPLDTSLVNPGFEDGDVNWTKGAGFTIDNGLFPFAGTWSARHVGVGQSRIEQTTKHAVKPGTVIEFGAMFHQGSADAGDATGWAALVWYDAGDVEIDTSPGLVITRGSSYRLSSGSGVAPPNAAKVAMAGEVSKSSAAAVDFDNFTWNYVNAQADISGLAYQAVQAEPGVSGAVEPTWPTVLAAQVVDNEVTWEAINAAYVTWEAKPLYETGSVEPVWPTEPGGVVSDGTIAWVASSRYVEEAPQSKIVWRGVSKIFAFDDDIIAYSATVNPLDWRTEKDAGYLPFGMNQYGDMPGTALGGYRGNLVAFNERGFQMWQIDENPANMSILDALPIGSEYHGALSPINNDLFFLTSLGVRSIGIAGASTNLQAGDVGMPIDTLVQDAMIIAAADGNRPISIYHPAAGQYLLAFREDDPILPTISGAMSDAFIRDAGTYQYTVTGTEVPLVVTVTDGALPPGATIDTDGLVTFDYTAPGDYTWTLTVTDANGATDTVDDGITITGYSFFAVSSAYIEGTYARSDDGLDWSQPLLKSDPGDPGPAANIAAAGGGKILLGGRVSSDNGATWDDSDNGVGASNNRCIYAEDAFLIAANSSNIKRSVDGITFTAIIVPDAPGFGTDNLNAISAMEGLIVACGYWPHLSVDGGLNWTSPTATAVFDTSNIVRSLANDGTAFIAGIGNGALRRSVDGITWSALVSPFAGASAVYGMAWTNNVWVAGNVAGEFAYSVDGITWTLSPDTLGAAIEKIVAANGLFVAVGAAGKIATSVDGITWTNRPSAFGVSAIDDVTVAETP